MDDNVDLDRLDSVVSVGVDQEMGRDGCIVFSIELAFV